MEGSSLVLAGLLILLSSWQQVYGILIAPTLSNYTIKNARDTFDICKELSGLHREIPLEELLPKFNLPTDLPRHKHINLAKFIKLMQDVQPDVQIVFAPMLFGEADLSGVLSPGLPKLIHFTVKDKNKLNPHQVVSMASWARHNPGHSILLFDDADIHLFMITYFPELLSTFDGLASQVERTDMWRYLVLCIFGGVYADSDVVSARPLSQWVQDAGLLTGIENVFTSFEEAKKRTYTRQVQMVQWIIAAKRGHPVVCRMGEYVRRHVAKELTGEFYDPDRNHAILERTGPGIWSSSVHDYIMEHGHNITDVVAGMKIGDVRILPQPVFGCASSTFNPEHDPVPYVYHMFKGSWRVATPNKVWTFLKATYKWLAGIQDSEEPLHDYKGPHDDIAAADEDSVVLEEDPILGPSSTSAGRSSSNHLPESRKLRAVGRGGGVGTATVHHPVDVPFKFDTPDKILPLCLMVAVFLLLVLLVWVVVRTVLLLVITFLSSSPLVARCVAIAKQRLLQGLLISQEILRASAIRASCLLRPWLRRQSIWLGSLWGVGGSSSSSSSSRDGLWPLQRLQSGPSEDVWEVMDCFAGSQSLADVGRLKRVSSGSPLQQYKQ